MKFGRSLDYRFSNPLKGVLSDLRGWTCRRPQYWHDLVRSTVHCVQETTHRDVDAPEVQNIAAVSHTRHSTPLNKVGPIGFGRREGVGFMLKSRNEYFHDDSVEEFF